MHVQPLLSADQLALLREALSEYTVDGVHALVGPVGQAALARGDLPGLGRRLGDDEVSWLVRLFLLGASVPGDAGARALHPLPLSQAGALVAVEGDTVRARFEIRPYAEDGAPESWWVFSDFGSDVRPGALAADHVLGIGAAALTLAQATVRRPIGTALDIGTGCGVQALHLSGHTTRVTATDVSSRALRLAATTAAINGLDWELLAGSLLEPVAGREFDLVVANPPFVLSPWPAGAGGYDYRDGGADVTRLLVEGVPGVLAEGGTGQVLGNWPITADQSWDERLSGWLAGRGCDAWVWQREVADPGEYVSLWLRDAGERPGTRSWISRYDEWCTWFESAGVLAVGMGLVNLRRTDRAHPLVVCEDLPQPVSQPAGPWVDGWFTRHEWLAALDDAALLGARLRVADDVLLTTDARPGAEPSRQVLRQTGGPRWEVEVDEPVTRLLAGCDGGPPLGACVAVLAAWLGRPEGEVRRAVLPVVRDLLGRGFLERAG